MQTGDQSETIAFLTAAGGRERHETHISLIFLTAGLAWKLKRAVRLPYADFSTPDLRLAACRKELALNRDAAPGLYRKVRSITRRDDGGLEWDGPGAAVDHVVEMARFDQRDLFSVMAAEGRLPLPTIETLAAEIAARHAAAPVAGDPAGAARVARVLAVNEAGFATSHVLPAPDVDRLSAQFRHKLDGHAARLDDRARGGRVRRYHGDLHLRNICQWQGRPRLFDCLEFNDDLATTDTLYDLAFVLMDLWDTGLHQHANRLANRYMDAVEGEDVSGWTLLPFFMAIRAAVRAHVTATQAEESRGAAGFDDLAGRARRYLDLARTLLDPARGRVIALAGLSGSGKTTLAERLAPELAPPPGARILETDRIRKALFGVAATRRLPAEAYAPAVSQRVYARLSDRVAALADQQAAVIATAVLDRRADRDALAAAAGGHRFDGIWLSAAPGVLRARIGARSAGASDADAAVLDRQIAAQAAMPDDWPRIDVSGDVPDTLARLRCALGLPAAAGRH